MNRKVKTLIETALDDSYYPDPGQMINAETMFNVLVDYFKKECSHDEIKITGRAETENLECSCGFKIPF